jgi:hypothetical protein
MSNIYATHKPEQSSGGLYLKFTGRPDRQGTDSQRTGNIPE